MSQSSTHPHRMARMTSGSRACVMLALLVVGTILAPYAQASQPAPRKSAARTPATPESVFAEAGECFQAGLRSADAEPGSGTAEFLAAADLYQSLIVEHGIENHALHADRGSALLLAGDTGRAIAAFRRAQRLDPTDVAARDGLAAARRRVGAATPPDAAGQFRNVLLAWRGYVPRPLLLAVGVAAYGLAWISAALRLLALRRATPIALGCAALCAICVAPLAIEASIDSGSDQGVVIADGVIGLNGPSSGAYAPTFAQPLGAGIEFDVIEQRDAWVHVRLADGRETWLPADAIERI